MFRRKSMESKEISVKFGGQVEQVDINTFTRILLDYSTVLSASCREVDENYKVDTNIRAVRPGCLVVDMSVVTDGFGSLFKDPATALQTISSTVTVALGFYEFKRFLGKHGNVSSVDQSGEESSVTAADGSKQTFNIRTMNVYMKSPEASDAVNSSFAVLSDDPSIDSIEMDDKDGNRFFASRDEFPDISTSPSYEGPDVKHVSETCNLIVVKPYLGISTKRKWEFVWRGTKMSANIIDEEWMSGIPDEPFYVGSIMNADVDITMRYDQTNHAYMNKSFTITKVHDVTRPPENQRIF